MTNPSKQAGSAPTRATQGLLLGLLLVLLGAVYVYRTVHTVIVDGPSMEPTFRSGDELLVSNAFWLFGKVARDDIVVVRTGDGGYLIKRVHRIGGEQVDWEFVPESYDSRLGPYVVPDGNLFILGDNLPQSEDSRQFGSVPEGRVIGKVIRRL